MTSADMNSLEGKGRHQSAVPVSEEVASSPKIKHRPIIDIDNLLKISPSDACHPPPGPPGFLV